MTREQEPGLFINGTKGTSCAFVSILTAASQILIFVFCFFFFFAARLKAESPCSRRRYSLPPHLSMDGRAASTLISFVYLGGVWRGV